MKKSTYESYVFRINRIQQYFEGKNTKLINVTPKIVDTFFKYSLKYGKVNQKTKEREPLAVRSVRSYKSILYAVFNQAVIDGLIRYNPVIEYSAATEYSRDRG